jgi:hypothetical protein
MIPSARRAVLAICLLLPAWAFIHAIHWTFGSAAIVPAPLFKPPPQVHDFGTVMTLSKSHFNFATRNDLAAELVIDHVIRYCGCTTAAAEPSVVAPGGSFSVRTVLSAPAYRESLTSHVAVLAHAGDQNVEFDYQLLAAVENVLEFPEDEGFIRLGSWRLDQMPADTVIQVERGKYPLTFDGLSVECASLDLSASVAPSGSNAWQVLFHIQPTGSLGTVGYPVTFLPTDHGRAVDLQLDKQAYVEVIGPVMAAPSSLLLTVAPGEHVRKIITVAARSPNDGAPRVTAVSSMSPNAAVAFQGNSVTLDYAAPLRPGEDRGQITVAVTEDGRAYRLTVGYMALISRP